MDPDTLNTVVALAEALKGPLFALLIGGAAVISTRQLARSFTHRESELRDEVDAVKRRIESLHDDMELLYDQVDTAERRIERGSQLPTPV